MIQKIDRGLGDSPYAIEADSFGEALEYAISSGYDLSWAKLSDQDLSGVNWAGCDLNHACFDRSEIGGSSWYRVNITGTRWRDVTLNGAKLWNTRPLTIMGPVGCDNKTHLVFFFKDGRQPEIDCYGYNVTLQQFIKHIKERYKDDPVEREDYLVALRNIYLIHRWQKKVLKATA